jgi:hypothetical protein
MRYLLLVLIAGCSRSDRVVVRGPDGPAVLVTCGSYDACLEEAAEGCPYGYDIVDKHSQASVFGYNGAIGSLHKDSLLVTCRRRTARSSATTE